LNIFHNITFSIVYCIFDNSINSNSQCNDDILGYLRKQTEFLDQCAIWDVKIYLQIFKHVFNKVPTDC